ncbi:FMN-dependent NADH-azoreductase [Paenalcaligenes sp. Me52]|uniref:FMN-dependent NADH-azoreductase n=1 Tax=Paenalcaligenes sp. Me52 TaxID=3392038 RepID=UPI003D2B3DE8
MSILRLTCSPQGERSESYLLSQHILHHLAAVDPVQATEVTELHTNSLPHVDEEYAITLGSAVDPEHQEGGSLSLSQQLMQTLAEADYVVIATPMHNFTVPSGLKAWIDHVVRVRHTFQATPEGKVGTLKDRPVFIAMSSGGLVTGGRARQPDFLTPYLRTVFATIGIHNLTFFSVQGTALGTTAREAAQQDAHAEIARHFASMK